MTINDLLKLVPEEYRDKIIVINIPFCRDGDQGKYPLIEVDIENKNLIGGISIILSADF